VSPYWWNYWTVLPNRSAWRLGTHLAKQNRNGQRLELAAHIFAHQYLSYT
jgi:hypothetical protein